MDEKNWPVIYLFVQLLQRTVTTYLWWPTQPEVKVTRCFAIINCSGLQVAVLVATKMLCSICTYRYLPIRCVVVGWWFSYFTVQCWVARHKTLLFCFILILSRWMTFITNDNEFRFVCMNCTYRYLLLQCTRHEDCCRRQMMSSRKSMYACVIFVCFGFLWSSHLRAGWLFLSLF